MTTKRLGCYGCTACFYCDVPLAGNHEHDHFPVPQSAGGTATVPACINCHSLKDRESVDDWPAQIFPDLMVAWPTLPPLVRLFIAKVIRLEYEQVSDVR